MSRRRLEPFPVATMRRIWGAIGLVALSSGCSSEPDVPVAGTGGVGSGGPADFSADIRRTSYGVPHILAETVADAAFGVGYIAAEEHVCTLADQFVKVRSERSMFFGPGENDANLDSDFAILHGGIYERASLFLDESSEEVQEIVAGYASGYNRYLSETSGAELPEECRSASWVRPVSSEDVAAYIYYLALFASFDPLIPFMATAFPPDADGEVNAHMLSVLDTRAIRRLRGSNGTASNGWAIGSERSENGLGMVLVNPHFPWEGNRLFHELQVTVPGDFDIYGVALLGSPVVNIGFTTNLGWTHTVTTAKRFTVYVLDLADSPTTYVFGDDTREVEGTEYTISVRGEGGEFEDMSRTLYSSQYGPMLDLPGLGWSNRTAYTYRDANADNFATIPQWLGMARAEDIDDILDVSTEAQGIPWVNTVVATRDGETLYIDASRTPHLSEDALSAYASNLESDPLTQLGAALGIVLLRGSDPMNVWVDDDDAASPGIVPLSQSPQLRRNDYVANANDSYWLSNPNELLTGYSSMFGFEDVPQTPRTRLNFDMLEETGDGSAAGEDGLFSFEELAAVPYNGRAWVAEQLLERTLELCQGGNVGSGAGCDALGGWDGRLQLDSTGAVTWREFLSALDIEALYGEFDANDPVGSPAIDLDALTEAVADEAMTEAESLLAEANVAPDAALGDAQFALRNGMRIGVPGGNNIEGAFNIVGYAADTSTLLPFLDPGEFIDEDTSLANQGYPINQGASIIMPVAYTENGVEARSVLTYGNSGDPDTSNYSDQTRELFGEQTYKDVLFTDEQIEADPSYVIETVSGPRAPAGG